jgi:hypothetical protein
MRAALQGLDWDAVFDVSGVIQVAGGSAMADPADIPSGTDISGEVKRRFRPGLKAGVSTPRS